MSVRTFLALDIDDAAREALTAAGGRFPCDESKIRWVEPVNLHVTLKFLGDVGEPDTDAICRAVAEAAAAVEPFEFGVRGLRCVPGGGKVRMVWACVHEPAGRMAMMFERIESALEPLGFPRERRRFNPHVTLGRVRSTRNAAALREAAGQYAETDFGDQRAQNVVTYTSELTPEGPIYTALARAPIGGGPGAS